MLARGGRRAEHLLSQHEEIRSWSFIHFTRGVGVRRRREKDGPVDTEAAHPASAGQAHQKEAGGVSHQSGHGKDPRAGGLYPGSRWSQHRRQRQLGFPPQAELNMACIAEYQYQLFTVSAVQAHRDGADVSGLMRWTARNMEIAAAHLEDFVTLAGFFALASLDRPSARS